ncbi:MAG: hypothetical protein ACE5EN_05660, partial [Nitrospinota bacterium]
LPKPVEAHHASHIKMVSLASGKGVAGAESYEVEGFEHVTFRMINAGFGASVYQTPQSYAEQLAAAGKAAGDPTECAPDMD